MLELRPNCEACDKDLPPDSDAACICSYECTFCTDCVSMLRNVCPNCGGGFVPRPIRPLTERRAGVSRTHQPASTKRRKAKFNKIEMVAFSAMHRSVPPQDR